MSMPIIKQKLEMLMYYDALSKQIKLSKSTQLGSSLKDGALMMSYRDNRKLISKYKLHIPQQRSPQSTLREQSLAPHDYLKIHSKVDQVIMKNSSSKTSLQNSPHHLTSEKSQFKKQVLNDYLGMVTKRQEYVDQMQKSFARMDHIQDDTNVYLEKYYGQKSPRREGFKKTLDNLGNQVKNSYICKLIDGNQEVIDNKLYKNKSQQMEKEGRGMKRRGQTSDQQTPKRRPSLQNMKNLRLDDIKTKLELMDSVKLKLQKQQQLRNMMLDHEYKSKGYEGIKKQRFIKALIDNTPVQEVIPVITPKNKKKYSINQYIKKLDGEFQSVTFREQKKNKQCPETLKLHQFFKDRAQKQQLNIDMLLVDQQSHSDQVSDLIKSHRQIQCSDMSHRLFQNTTRTKLSSRQNRDDQCSSLKLQCKAATESNQQIHRSLSKQQRINDRGYGLLNQKYKKFQQQCELGDDLDGLKLA